MGAAEKIAYEPGSFKDPYGSVFYYNDKVYRTLTDEAYGVFRDLSDRGILETFISRGFLMDSRLKAVSEVKGLSPSISPSGFVIEQDKIPVMTYPYEWCFSQLKDAALKTLDFLECCLENDLMLKDATAFNLALYGGDLRFFDVLSIEPYKENQPWMAYRQFCQQFLFPLLLASYKGMDTQFLMRGYFQDLSASHVKHYFSGFDIFKPGILKHVTLLSMMEKSYESKEIKVKDAMKQTHFPKILIENNVKNLRKTIAGLSYFVSKSEWGDYITECNYEDEDRKTKHAFIENFVKTETPKSVIDLGCNTGEYSSLAAKSAEVVISADSDALAIERLYARIKTEGTPNIIPMVTNLLNPTPALGWALGERKSFFERFNGIDGFFALALVHHICISGNVPVTKCVEMLADLGRSGVVEWVDKKDEQVQKLLRNREDVFGDYTWENFEAALKANFKIVKVEETHGGNRKLCHVKAL